MSIIKNIIPKRNSRSSKGNSRTAQKSNGSSSSSKPIANFGGNIDSDDTPVDVCQCVLYCSQHNAIAVRLFRNKLWIPMIQLDIRDSWRVAAIALVDLILEKSRPESLKARPIHTFRAQLVQVCTFSSRVTFMADARHTRKIPNCYKSNDKYRWIGIDDAISNRGVRFWGPEPYHWIMNHVLNRPTPFGTNPLDEFSLKTALRYLPRDKPQFKEDELLKAAAIREKDISKMYARFVCHCWPSQFMAFMSFKQFMSELNWKYDNQRLSAVFRAFDYTRSGYLSFHELLLGFAAMDENTAHGGMAGELRCGYIFRYYDTDSDGLWDEENVCDLIVDMQSGKMDRKSVTERANATIKKFGTDNTISYKQFAGAVSTLNFRGTSKLFRSSTVASLRIAQHSVTASYSSGAAEMVVNRQYKGVCKGCHERKYSLSEHLIQIDMRGNLKQLSNLKNTVPNVKFIDDLVERQTLELAIDMMHRVRQFNHYSRLADGRPADASPEHMRNLFFESHDVFMQKLLALITLAENMFAAEKRIVTVCSPAVIMGDIHGNLSDLMIYDRNLWRLSPFVNAATYVFLGDYVDRGPYGIQCVAYLFAMKILAPHRFVLLRGNHEHKPLQEMFTFKAECFSNANAQVFDANIATPLPDPEYQSPEAWQILWNDPISESDFEKAVSLRQGDMSLVSKGFISNIKRGTAYFYNELAVNNFLSANSLSHVVRAHEVFQEGYRFMMKGRVTSVFSSSRYCGLNNVAAVIFVDREKLRVVRIET